MNGTGIRNRSVEIVVFCLLLVSYSWFWHARDWNSASRLMLACALVDRGSFHIDGLHTQTGDLAFLDGHYYTEKFPGFSMLAAIPYGLAKWTLGQPNHPLNIPGIPYWPTDYWVALATSGLITALTGALLCSMCRQLGCTIGQSALLALAYGLGTPAYVYATMSYGHQLVAGLGLMSLAWLRSTPIKTWQALAAGAAAAFVSVVELQSAPISALLAFYALGRAIRGQIRWKHAALFAIGAMGPTLVLAFYNYWAFGSPWELGYFHLANEFARVHTKSNPLGFAGPDWSVASQLLWGEYRGLLFYAPILILTVPGWIALAVRKNWDVLILSVLICLGVFGVNLSYPEWTGGWSTGPRMLVPLLPFAVLAVAGLLAWGNGRRAGKWITKIALGLSLAGMLLMTLFQGIGGHVPQGEFHPLTNVVWPIWMGERLPAWTTGSRFVWMPILKIMPELSERWRCLGLLPLITIQITVGVWLVWLSKRIAGAANQETSPRAQEKK